MKYLVKKTNMKVHVVVLYNYSGSSSIGTPYARFVKQPHRDMERPHPISTLKSFSSTLFFADFDFCRFSVKFSKVIRVLVLILILSTLL